MTFLSELRPWEWLLVGFFGSALVGGVAVPLAVWLVSRGLAATFAPFSSGPRVGGK